MSELGKSIKQATQLLQVVHEDVALLIDSLDETMEENGWHTDQDLPVTDSLGEELDSFHWVIPYAMRVYLDVQAEKASRNVCIVHVEFAPAAYEEAMCLGIAMRLAKAHTHDEVWYKPWDNRQNLFAYLSEHFGPVELTKKLIEESEFLRQAKNISAFAVPLCELDSADKLRERLIRPLLNLHQSL